MGKMGAGKTLSMSLFAEYMHKMTGSPLYSNYRLQGASKIESLNTMTEVEGGIFCFDEMWLTLDSRLWSDNVKLTRWVNQTRKKKMIILYTTQHIRQIEMRARNATDVLVYCEKRADGHWLQFIDWQYRQMGRRYLINHSTARRFYGIYDTYEVLEPLTFKKEYTNHSKGYNRQDDFGVF